MLKRILCFLLSVVLCSVCLVAQGVIDNSMSTPLYFEQDILNYKISHFLDNSVMFNDCDQVKNGREEIVANLNSSKLELSATEKKATQGAASAKFTKKYYNNCDIPITIRSNSEVSLSEYQYLEFDIYLSKGLKCAAVPDPELSSNAHYYFAWIYFQSRWCNGISDSTIHKQDISGVFSDLPSQAWTHFKIMLPQNVNRDCVQFTLHLSDVMLRGDDGEYVCIDNVRFTKSEGSRQLTIQDKDEVLRMQAAYQALPDAKKKEISTANVKALNGWVTQMEQLIQDNTSAAVKEVMALFEKLPAENDVTVSHKLMIMAAKLAYEELSETEKLAVTNLELLEAAQRGLEKALSEQRIEQVTQLIAALPEAQTVTLDDWDRFEEANNAYHALDMFEQVEVNGIAKLQAIERALQNLKNTVDERIEKVNRGISSYVIGQDAPDLNNVLAVFEKYDELSGSEKQQIPQAKALFQAARKLSVAGDVDGNTVTDAKDALKILQSAVGKTTLTGWQQAVGDVTQDEKLDAVDALNVLKIAVGK